MIKFENEYTVRKFMISKGEEEFHNRYSEAVIDIKSQFGKKYTMIIDGEDVKSAKTFVHISPIDTRIILGYFPNGNTGHAGAAIKAAKRSFIEEWKKTDYKYRIQICKAAADIIANRKFELAAWISYENGKNRYEAIADVDEAIDFIRYYSEEIQRSNGFTVETNKAESNEESISVMKPYGVWGVITPFNFPAAILIGMSIGALITGNPVIVTENADIDKAVEGVLKAAFGYSGQKCSACSRLYIHRDIKRVFMERLVHRTKNLPVGNPLEPNVFMGPLINSKAYNKYQKFSKIAFRDGSVLVGGAVRDNDDFKHGYYAEPTIVDGLPKNHRLFKEELFVPILCVAEYDKYNDVLNLCNDSEYGLTAGIYSNKKDEIESFLDIVDAGVIYINRYGSATTGAMVGCQPFGGWKASGTTGKGTGGPYYLMQFLREQSQTIAG